MAFAINLFPARGSVKAAGNFEVQKLDSDLVYNVRTYRGGFHIY